MEMKPGRPLGVTIAIVLSVFLFSLLPLAEVALVLYSRSRISYDPDLSVFAGGSLLSGVSGTTLLTQMLLGLVFFVIAVSAWRGRPPYMRFVFMGMILLLTLMTIVMNLVPSLNATCTQLPCDSLDAVKQQVACVKLPFTTLIPLYVIWYLNRAPARAFYRGYYLPENDSRDSETAADTA